MFNQKFKTMKTIQKTLERIVNNPFVLTAIGLVLIHLLTQISACLMGYEPELVVGLAGRLVSSYKDKKL